MNKKLFLVASLLPTAICAYTGFGLYRIRWQPLQETNKDLQAKIVTLEEENNELEAGNLKLKRDLNTAIDTAEGLLSDIETLSSESYYQGYQDKADDYSRVLAEQNDRWNEEIKESLLEDAREAREESDKWLRGAV